MTDRTRQLLAEILELPDAERAELAAEIMATLDHDVAPGGEVETAWASEVERRIEGYLSGKDQAIPWEEVRAEALRRLRGE